MVCLEEGNLGLPQGTEAPVMMPNSKSFSFLFFKHGSISSVNKGPRYTLALLGIKLLEAIFDSDEARLPHMQDISVSHGVGNV